MSDEQHPVVFGQGRQRRAPPDAGPRVRAHGGRFRVHALGRELSGAPDARAEGEQRQLRQVRVAVARLPNQLQRLAPVPLPEHLARLFQQTARGEAGGGGGGCRPLAFATAAFAFARHRLASSARHLTGADSRPIQTGLDHAIASFTCRTRT